MLSLSINSLASHRDLARECVITSRVCRLRSVQSRVKTPTWEWKWEGVVMNTGGNGKFGNYPYSIPTGKIPTDFLLSACLRAEICPPLRHSTITDITILKDDC